MMDYKELDARVARERTDMVQLWDAWIAADDLRRHSFRGSLRWEQRNGREYLFRRQKGIAKSLGPRGPETEASHRAFHDGREANAAHLAALSAEMDRQAPILRSLDAGRLPAMAARVLRALRTREKGAAIRVIGTTALYAYEALAGVTFNAESTESEEIDFLVDDRNQLRLLTETDQQIGLTKLVQKAVDKSFQPHGPNRFRLVNDKGFVIAFVRPDPIPRPTPKAEPSVAGGVQPAPNLGLQWLVDAPAVDAVVLDEDGLPAPMRCADPRWWTAHKLWLSHRPDSDPLTILRNRTQAEAMQRLLAEKLPQHPLDAGFLAQLPPVLAGLIPAAPIQRSR